MFWGKWQILVEWTVKCTVLIPLQCGVSAAGGAISYSSAMVIICKAGDSTGNGTPLKVGHGFQTRLFLRQSLLHRGQM